MLINQITEKYPNLKYMNHSQAVYMRDLILSNNLQNLCELGHYHGKSSAYLASILKERGSGKLTTYDLTSTTVKPCIQDLLTEFDLQEWVNVVLSAEGYIWDLVEHIKQQPENKFDFCYLDGGHTLESTGLGFTLINILLRPGGYIVLDDVKWTINSSPAYAAYKKRLTEKQLNAHNVEMVCDYIIENSGYQLIERNKQLNWAVYKKP